MTEHSYPHDYLPLPLMENYGFQAASPLLRTEMASGRARQRRRYTSTPTVATVNWTFTTNPQAMLFEAWFRDVLKDGANWFMMQLQTPLGDLQWFKCRFTGGLAAAFCGACREQVSYSQSGRNHGHGQTGAEQWRNRHKMAGFYDENRAGF